MFPFIKKCLPESSSILLLLLLFPILAGARTLAPESIEGVKIVTAEQLIELLLNSSEIVLIDTRLEEEFKMGHIEGAINILDTIINEEDLAIRAEDTNSPIAFYCNGIRCLRSSNAARKAVDWGYQNIYWFRGGWTEWKEKHYPASW